MGAKHTPRLKYELIDDAGPAEHDAEIFIAGDGDTNEHEIAHLFHAISPEGEVELSAHEMAPLIAAAPRLLAALEGMVDAVYCGGDDGSRLREANEAIREAKGGSA